MGSIVLSRYGGTIRPARVMVVGGFMWYLMLLVFASVPYHKPGIAILIVAGFAQSLSQVPMAAVLLRTSDDQFRGRVMGIRMLAIYGNMPGLLLAAPLIAHMGYRFTASLYCAIGLTFALLIAIRWRRHLWRPTAAANSR